jgi:putative transcriptional regulator
MRAKSGSIVRLSDSEARRVKIDWAKIDATTEADIARHAREDGTVTPSDRVWKKMVREGRVRLMPPVKVDVRGIRERLKLSQSDFAARFGFTAAAVRQWEQGRRQPHGPARVLLTIIDREPNAVRRALESGQ